jgi:CRISPR-associated endonuclease/helicase Cas3
LDEVQAVPPKYYKIIEEVFQVLCTKFNSYVITVTATKPLFLVGEELVKSNREIFNSLDRIQIENHINTPVYLNDFSEMVLEDVNKNQDKSFLIVLNTVKSASKVLEKLMESGRKVLFLSTEIFPLRRLEIINLIKDDKATKYVLVSTQLIEAGVDLDFDMVYRDFSTIDSINQTAGRANRNAVKGKGIVKLFMLMNEDHNAKKFCRYIYPEPLLETTERILSSRRIISEREI